MLFSGLHHVGFTVPSLDRSIPFYTRLLGVEPTARVLLDDQEFVGRCVGYPGVKIEAAFFPLPGGAVLELLQYHNPAPGTVDMETYNTGNAHLGLLTDDIHADVERLRGHVELRHPEPVEIPSGPFKGGWGLYLRDPDGITIEFLQLPAASA